jgi:hypothetical protein
MMEGGQRPVEDVDTLLYDLVETHVRKLSNTLSSSSTLEEVEAEVNALNNLIYTYKRRDELLEKLLDTSIPDEKRRQIRETMQALSVKVEENTEKLAKDHDRAHKLIERSVALIAKAQRHLGKAAHLHSGYSVKGCGLCTSTGHNGRTLCGVCNGEGRVIVRQPSRKCIKCWGSGKAPRVWGHKDALCPECKGSGWVHTSPFGQ